MKAVVLALAIGSVAVASEALPPRLYNVTTETGMPHLEENLRYSVTQETRCLARENLAAAFPILAHVSLKDCRLEPDSEQGGTLVYRLVCTGGHGTTGDATWELGKDQVTGTLRVKLGGKNMTFYQLVRAVPVGQCEANVQ
jgi:hypothetical protein